jgi:adenylyl cyclase-associated protein
METALVERLEAAVARLEAAIASGSVSASAREIDGDLPAATDPAILALDELMDGPVRRVVAAAEKIGGKVLESTKILEQAFGVQKELLIKAKQSQVWICVIC